MVNRYLSYKTYCCSCDADWMVFIHGAGGSRATWFKQIKFFRKSHNILLVDLRGHGRSISLSHELNIQSYTFDLVTDDVLDLLVYLNIQKAHFIGMSLGSIIVRYIAEKKSSLVISMVLAGATVKLNLFAKGLVILGGVLKNILPYIWLYWFFAMMIMPQRSQKEARLLFMSEAKKLNQREFKRWFALTKEIDSLMHSLMSKYTKKPTLYVMGDKDRLFLRSVINNVQCHDFYLLHIISKCGHVCNIEKPDEFNAVVAQFMKATAEEKRVS